MTIHITLTPNQERQLEQLARACSQEPTAHAHDVVTAYFDGACQIGTKSFNEIFAPIWEGWRAHAMTDGEVEDLFEQELREPRAERRQAKEPSEFSHPGTTKRG